MAPKPTSFLQVEMRQVESLIPYARNARTHTDGQVAQIAASITEFGWTNPILVDGDNGVIAGHGRLLAARKLGLDTVPVIELANLTPQQKRAYILADNKLAENAGWDEELLRIELAALTAEAIDLSLTGFNDEEFADLLGDVEPLDELPALPDGDRVPFQQMTFFLHYEQVKSVNRAMAVAKKLGPFPKGPNKNGNGNALARVCELFVGDHEHS